MIAMLTLFALCALALGYALDREWKRLILLRRRAAWGARLVRIGAQIATAGPAFAAMGTSATQAAAAMQRMAQQIEAASLRAQDFAPYPQDFAERIRKAMGDRR